MNASLVTVTQNVISGLEGETREPLFHHAKNEKYSVKVQSWKVQKNTEKFYPESPNRYAIKLSIVFYDLIK